VKRRLFLQRLLGIGLLSASAWLLKIQFFPGILNRKERQIFNTFINRLIPDDDTPGAVALGVPEKLIALAKTDKSYRQLFKYGCAWLEQQAQALTKDDFINLDAKQQDNIISLAEKAPFNSIPQKFFQIVRLNAMKNYYADPRSWAELAYATPPQPNGFLDYQEPPKQQ